MSAGIEELIVPVRMDPGAAIAALKKLEKAGNEAGEETAKGMHKAEEGAKGLGNEIANILKAQIGFSAFSQLAGKISDQFRETAENIGRTSREFQQFRETLQNTAALTGNENTNKFAEAEISRAERAHVTPQEMKNFRESFLSRASLYVGNGPQAKLSEADANRFQEQLAEYAKLRGISQAEMASFAGGLLAQQKGPTNFDQMSGRVGRAFATLEASSAPVAHLLPAMTRVMAQGYSAEEASRTLAALPEVAPEEEGTHLLRVMAEIRRNTLEGKGEQFGIKKGARSEEQLRGLVENFRGRSGGDEEKLNGLLAQFTHEDIAANTLRGMVNQVDFNQWRAVQEGIAPDEMNRLIGSGRQSEAGRQYAVSSRLAVEHARMGLRNDTLERRRQIAEAELTAAGAFEHVPWMDRAKALLPLTDDLRTQQINRQALYRARAELGESPTRTDIAMSHSRSLTDERLRELLERIEQNTRKADGGKALTVPTPVNNGGVRQ